MPHEKIKAFTLQAFANFAWPQALPRTGLVSKESSPHPPREPSPFLGHSDLPESNLGQRRTTFAAAKSGQKFLEVGNRRSHQYRMPPDEFLGILGLEISCPYSIRSDRLRPIKENAGKFFKNGKLLEL